MDSQCHKKKLHDDNDKTYFGYIIQTLNTYDTRMLVFVADLKYIALSSTAVDIYILLFLSN